MGLLDYGTGVQAFTDNFLKTYMAFDESDRAKEAQKMKKDMQAQQIAEMLQQQIFRDAQMREINAQAAQREEALRLQTAKQRDYAQLQDNQLGNYVQGMINADPRYVKGLLSDQPSLKDYLAIEYKYNPEKAATLEAQMENTKSNNEMKLALERMRQEGQNNRQQIKINVGGGSAGYSKEDRDIVKPLFSKMPEMQKNARESVFKINQYKQLSSMLDKGAGGVEGGLKAALAPVAEYLGMDSKGMSEAQAYQLIARAGAGAMRLQLIGPGQVSEYEQKLIQKLSGGNIGTSRQAARDLFAFYSAQAKQNISAYNDAVDSLVGAGYGKIGKIYKKIDIGQPTQQPASRTVVEQRRTKDGRILTKYSDGSIE